MFYAFESDKFTCAGNAKKAPAAAKESATQLEAATRFAESNNCLDTAILEPILHNDVTHYSDWKNLYLEGRQAVIETLEDAYQIARTMNPVVVLFAQLVFLNRDNAKIPAVLVSVDDIKDYKALVRFDMEQGKIIHINVTRNFDLAAITQSGTYPSGTQQWVKLADPVKDNKHLTQE